MEIVPVLDLRGGLAVHARGGDRARYRIVDGVLGSGHDPLALAVALRDRLGRRSLYVADLDAIAGRGDARPFVARLAGLGIAPIVDAGIRTAASARALLAAGAARVVVGLETLGSLEDLEAVVHDIGAMNVVFSLDLRAGRPLAAAAALAATPPLEIAVQAAARGVRRMIVLDVARVGSGAGVPRDLLREVRSRLPTIELLAGGGVRDALDLEVLAGLGCAGALVATALHRGRIGRAEVARFAAA